MIRYFKNIFCGALAIAQGMWLTLKTMVKPSITVQYPTEKLVPYENYRGVLLFDPGTCISCSLCVKACPSACIALMNQFHPETKKRVAKVDWYSIDFGKCNFCKLCEEACPTKPKSVWHSLDYELIFPNRDEMVRCWKQGFDYMGKYFDRKAGDFKTPTGQISIHSVQGRHG